MKKQNYSYVGIAFIILVFGIIFIPKIVDRFQHKNIVDKDRHQIGKKTEDLHKFYKIPNFEFVNQHGDTITNDTYKGKVYVVEFFFTSCPTICPIMNKRLVDLQNDFMNKNDFGIASISITPDIDTPKVLKQYTTKYGITHKNWHLLTGKPNEYVYKLSNEGFKLYTGKGEENHGGFEHSGLFALIDKTGHIRSRYDEHGNPIMYYRALDEQNFKNQIQELKKDINILLNE